MNIPQKLLFKLSVTEQLDLPCAPEIRQTWIVEAECFSEAEDIFWETVKEWKREHCPPNGTIVPPIFRLCHVKPYRATVILRVV